MISLQLIALSLLAVVSASPLDARATCPGGPNFEGAGISILGANGFVTPNGRGHGSPAPFWHIQQTGQPNGGYIFKDIDNNNIALTRNSDGTVTMTPASNSGTDPNQQFQIEMRLRLRLREERDLGMDDRWIAKSSIDVSQCPCLAIIEALRRRLESACPLRTCQVAIPSLPQTHRAPAFRNAAHNSDTGSTTVLRNGSLLVGIKGRSSLQQPSPLTAQQHFSMMISPQLIALSLLAVVSASPLDARATCSPNFEGAGIAVGAPGGFVFPGGLNRGHSAFVPAWHIQQTGQPNGGYIFKDIWNNNIALTRNSDNTVTVAPASDSGTDRNQQFQITCGLGIPVSVFRSPTECSCLPAITSQDLDPSPSPLEFVWDIV
uniref:Uncharacterized protein n=1 Tax=Moniliophthora roreri TaxID=221103 RepID=A0A0W0GDG5_MONRR